MKAPVMALLVTSVLALSACADDAEGDRAMDTGEMPADSMMTLMPAHRQLGENMLEQMDEEMRAMNMQPDAQWNAAADSVRQDMTRMPDMSAAELQAFMPEHRARMMRLMDMHRSMMSSMQH